MLECISWLTLMRKANVQIQYCSEPNSQYTAVSKIDSSSTIIIVSTFSNEITLFWFVELKIFFQMKRVYRWNKGLKVRLHCLVIAWSDLPGYHENPSTSIRDAFTQQVTTLVSFAHQTVWLPRKPIMLATCTLVLVVDFSRDRNHGLSLTVCQLLFRF